MITYQLPTRLPSFPPLAGPCVPSRLSHGFKVAKKLDHGPAASKRIPIGYQPNDGVFAGHPKTISLLQHEFMGAGPAKPVVSGRMRGDPVWLTLVIQ